MLLFYLGGAQELLLHGNKSSRLVGLRRALLRLRQVLSWTYLKWKEGRENDEEKVANRKRGQQGYEMTARPPAQRPPPASATWRRQDGRRRSGFSGGAGAGTRARARAGARVWRRVWDRGPESATGPGRATERGEGAGGGRELVRAHPNPGAQGHRQPVGELRERAARGRGAEQRGRRRGLCGIPR